MLRWVWLWFVVVAGTAGAQEQQTREFPVHWASAEDVAALFGPPPSGAPEVVAMERLSHTSDPAQLARQLLPPPAGTAGRWVLYIGSANLTAPRSVPGQPGDLTSLRPPGLVGPVAAVAGRNVVSATGTPDSLGKLGEIIALLDRPARRVRLEVMVLDPEVARSAAADADWAESQTEGGTPTRFAHMALDKAIAPELRLALPTTAILTDNTRNAQAQFTELLPHLTEVNGQMVPRAVVAAVRAMLQPRVNADDSVTLAIYGTTMTTLVEPTSDTAGYPTARSEVSSTVRVKSGETLLLQLPATGADEILDQWLADHTALGTRYLRTPVLAITPHVLPPLVSTAQVPEQPGQ